MKQQRALNDIFLFGIINTQKEDLCVLNNGYTCQKNKEIRCHTWNLNSNNKPCNTPIPH